MTPDRDLGRKLDLWLAEGFDQVNDRVLDNVEQRIRQHRQRPAWRLTWRDSHVNTTYKLLVGLAAVLVVAVVGYNLLPRQPGTGSPSLSPVATPSPTATAVGIRDVPDIGGRLDPGQWQLRPGPVGSSLSVVADVPAGWLALEGQRGFENAVATNSAPSGIAILFEMPAHGLFSDPCHWDLAGTGNFEQDGDVVFGPNVADLVGALRANASFTSSTASPVAFGPYSGQLLELRFPADLDPATCDAATGGEEGRYRVLPDTIYSQGKANIWRMSIIDVAGTRLVSFIEYFPGTAPDKLAEAQAIVDSFVFTP